MQLEKMNPEVKSLWVAALRGESEVKYQQGKQALKSDAGHCCLGVLCDIHRSVTGNGEWKNNHLGWMYGNPGSGSCLFLPEVVRKWAGIQKVDPVVKTSDTGTDPVIPGPGSGSLVGLVRLSSLNDSGVTFREIAGLIEKYL